jgi:hypothetical protein
VPRARLRGMTTKERLHALVEEKERMHRLVDELSELEAESALSLLEKEPADPEPAEDEDEAALPGDIIDDWGNLSAMKRHAAERKMKRLTEEEIAANGNTLAEAWGYEPKHPQ